MRFTLFLATLLLLNNQSAAQQGLVVGSLDYTLPAGNSIWVPPFVAEDSFSGRVENITYDPAENETLITLNTDTVPGVENHYLEICEGFEVGLALDIIGATGNSITIQGDPSSFDLATGQKVIIREHLTLAALLPQGANFSPFLDTVSIFNADGSRLDIFWNPISGNWMDSFNAVLDNQKILPGQGLLLFLNEGLTIRLGGSGRFTHVKTTPTRVQAHAGVVNLVGPVNPFPGSYQLSEIGFLSDFTPFQDSAGFFSRDGTFLPTETFLNDGGISTNNGSVFINGLGEDSSTFTVPYREATVVSVFSDKTIGFAQPQIDIVAP